jgi:type IV pilus assembly protein PilB
MHINNTVDLADVLEPMDNVPKLVRLVLLISLKDRATEIHFGHALRFVLNPVCDDDQFQINCKCGGYYEMVPPPEHLAAAIIAELRKMTGIGPPEKQGFFPIRVGNHVVLGLMHIRPSWFGEAVSIYLIEAHCASIAAGEILERLRRPPDDVLLEFDEEIPALDFENA